MYKHREQPTAALISQLSSQGCKKVSINLMQIHHEIIGRLMKEKATFVKPLSSQVLGQMLNVTPSYVRERMQLLISLNLVGVRHGRGGGYYIAIRTGNKSRWRKLTTVRANKKAGLTWGKCCW